MLTAPASVCVLSVAEPVMSANRWSVLDEDADDDMQQRTPSESPPALSAATASAATAAAAADNESRASTPQPGADMSRKALKRVGRKNKRIKRAAQLKQLVRDAQRAK